MRLIAGSLRDGQGPSTFCVNEDVDAVCSLVDAADTDRECPDGRVRNGIDQGRDQRFPDL